MYQKITNEEDQVWLLRAIVAFVAFQNVELESEKNEPLRIQTGLVLTHLSIDSTSPKIRRQALEAVESLVKKYPGLVSRMIRESVGVFVSRGVPAF